MGTGFVAHANNIMNIKMTRKCLIRMLKSDGVSINQGL